MYNTKIMLTDICFKKKKRCGNFVIIMIMTQILSIELDVYGSRNIALM